MAAGRDAILDDSVARGAGSSHADLADAFAFCSSSHNSAKYSMSIRWMKMYPPPTLRRKMRSVA